MYGNSRLSSSENSLRTSEKNLKKIFFNTSKPLLQHPLCGILRRVGPKNGQNGPSSFAANISKFLPCIRRSFSLECPKCSFSSEQCFERNFFYFFLFNGKLYFFSKKRCGNFTTRSFRKFHTRE